MLPSALPFISQRDYPRFQRIIGELVQTTYEEWAEDHAKSTAYRRSRNGYTEVPVLPDEFEGWLKQNRLAAHLELLWAFAEEMAERAPEPAHSRYN